MSRIKSFKVTLELEDLINNNDCLPDNIFAINTVATMISEAIFYNKRLIQNLEDGDDKREENADLVDFLKEKIVSYKKIKDSLI